MYHLFLFNGYYPLGGMNDYDGKFYSLEEAKIRAINSEAQYYQIVDFNFSAIESGSTDKLK